MNTFEVDLDSLQTKHKNISRYQTTNLLKNDSSIWFLQKENKRVKLNLHLNLQKLESQLPRKKCSYSELFWSAFSRIRTEYGVSLRFQSECRKMQTKITPNADTFYVVNYSDMKMFLKLPIKSLLRNNLFQTQNYK